MKSASKELKVGMKDIKIDDIEDLHDDMTDMLEVRKNEKSHARAIHRTLEHVSHHIAPTAHGIVARLHSHRHTILRAPQLHAASLHPCGCGVNAVDEMTAAPTTMTTLPQRPPLACHVRQS